MFITAKYVCASNTQKFCIAYRLIYPYGALRVHGRTCLCFRMYVFTLRSVSLGKVPRMQVVHYTVHAPTLNGICVTLLQHKLLNNTILRSKHVCGYVYITYKATCMLHVFIKNIVNTHYTPTDITYYTGCCTYDMVLRMFIVYVKVQKLTDRKQ